MMVRDCHAWVNHGGVRVTLAEVRSRFWFPKETQVVKRVQDRCVTCNRHEVKAYSTPPAATLPECRTRAAEPFDRVGLDFEGPLYATTRNGGVKNTLVALFTCCVTRAVHLDLVRD